MLSIVVDSPVSGQLLTIAIVFPFFNLHGFKVGDVVKCSEVWVFIVPWYLLYLIVPYCTLLYPVLWYLLYFGIYCTLYPARRFATLG